MAYYPPGGFFFRVEIAGSKASFQEVSGLDHEVEVEEVAGGGQNAYKYRLPTRLKYNNLVLKRGLEVDGNSVWGKFAQNFPVSMGVQSITNPFNVLIELLDEKENTIMAWEALNAYPVKWNVSGFNSMESKLVIESVEFAHHGLKVIGA